jgi:hypothetical protein
VGALAADPEEERRLHKLEEVDASERACRAAPSRTPSAAGSTPPGSGESLLPCRSHPLVCPSAATEIPPRCAPMVGAVSALFLLDIKGRVLEKHLGVGSSFCESNAVAAPTLLPSPEEEPEGETAGGGARPLLRS